MDNFTPEQIKKLADIMAIMAKKVVSKYGGDTNKTAVVKSINPNGTANVYFPTESSDTDNTIEVIIPSGLSVSENDMVKVCSSNTSNDKWISMKK